MIWRNVSWHLKTMRRTVILARWRYGHKSYPVDAVQWAACKTTEAKTNVGRCVAYPNAIILEDTNSPVRRLPKMRGSSD